MKDVIEKIVKEWLTKDRSLDDTVEQLYGKGSAELAVTITDILSKDYVRRDKITGDITLLYLDCKIPAMGYWDEGFKEALDKVMKILATGDVVD